MKKELNEGLNLHKSEFSLAALSLQKRSNIMKQKKFYSQ